VVTAFLLLSAACSVGVGTGQVSGAVNAPGCGLEGSPYELHPSFFAGHIAVDGQLEIRIQRGSDHEDNSDGLMILVREPGQVRTDLLGRPIEVTRERDAVVRMAFYLNETCEIDRDRVPVHYEAEAGTITFDNLYAPDITENDVETDAHFEDVSFVDPNDPDTRNAQLSGNFRFLFNRGRPAQRYP
jgi:hypothetical protein